MESSDISAPEFVFGDHGIKDRQELSHTGNDSSHFRFAVGKKPVIEFANSWIVLVCHQRGHIKTAFDMATAAPGHALAAEGSTVAIDGR